MPRVREKISLIHHDNLDSDDLSVSKMPHHDDVSEGNDVNIWDDISVMSSERILMNIDLDYEEKEASALIIDENKENEDDDGFVFKAFLNAIMFPELNEKQKKSPIQR